MTLQEQIANLQNAIATGTKSISIGDRNITYRDLDEMLKALAMLKAQLASSESPSLFTVSYIKPSKGL